MSVCPNCHKPLAGGAVKCLNCGKVIFPLNDIIMTSTNCIEGYEIYAYYETICAETVIPNGLLGALTTGTFFTISAVSEARSRSLNSLKELARKHGANAVIGLDIDVTDLNGNGMMVSANGTPVYLLPKGYDKTLETDYAETKREEEMREIEIQSRVDSIVDRLDSIDVSETEKMIIRYLVHYPTGENIMKIAAALPRSIGQDELKNALKSLIESGLIEKDDFGQYALKG